MLWTLALLAACAPEKPSGDEVTLHLQGDVQKPAAPRAGAPKPASISLSVETDPPGAAVQLDARAVGLTPVSMKEPRSEVAAAKLRVLLAGYKTVEKIVHFDRDQKLTFVLAKETPPVQNAKAPAPPPEDYKLDDLKDPYSVEK